jgi:hypothetical protein
MALRREHFFLCALFLLAFAGTILLVASDSVLEAFGLRDEPEAGARGATVPNGGSTPHALHVEGTARNAGAADGVNHESAAAATKLASLEVQLVADSGQIGTVQAALNPPAGVLSDNRSSSFRISDVPPGRYRLAIWATGFQPLRGEMVDLQPGEARKLQFTLAAGVTPRGRTVDAETSIPVANARVEFVGHTVVTSDANGEFQVPWAIPFSALEDMVVSHPEYDIIALKRHAWGDTNRMQIGLGRGKGAVLGRITQVGTREIPPEARVRAYLTNTDGTRELRRELTFRTEGEFSMARMTYGAYVLVLDFPGTDLPSRSEDVHVGSPAAMEVVFPFAGGIRLEGTLRARAGAPLPTRVELIGEDGQPVLAVTSGEGGVFLMEAAPAGRWRLRVHWGLPWFNTEHFEISAGEPVQLMEVDCDKKLIVR